MKDRGNRHGAVVNCLQNKIFVNPSPLPLLCEISGRFFRVKPIAKLIFKVQNFPEAVQFPTNPYY